MDPQSCLWLRMLKQALSYCSSTDSKAFLELHQYRKFCICRLITQAPSIFRLGFPRRMIFAESMSLFSYLAPKNFNLTFPKICNTFNLDCNHSSYVCIPDKVQHLYQLRLVFHKICLFTYSTQQANIFHFLIFFKFMCSNCNLYHYYNEFINVSEYQASQLAH